MHAQEPLDGVRRFEAPQLALSSSHHPMRLLGPIVLSQALLRMPDLKVATLEGTDAIVEEAVVQGLRSSLHGPLLRPSDAGYDETRKIWNGMIDRRPALIARRAYPTPSLGTKLTVTPAFQLRASST
jgi:hypothetical protein